MQAGSCCGASPAAEAAWRMQGLPRLIAYQPQCEPCRQLATKFSVVIDGKARVVLQVEGSAAGGGPVHYGYDYYNASHNEPDEHAAVNSEEAEGESERRKQLHERDPVNTLKLSVLCKQQLESAAAVHSVELSTALNSMDPAIAGQLKGMLGA